ncbi:MAG: D-alanine--D-alanine ligase, partial [Methylococcales bacterium]
MKTRNITQADKFGRVAVLMGGSSAEREISMQSGMAVYEALKRQQVDVMALNVEDQLIAQLDDKNIDRVFNVIHGRGGEDGLLQGVLEAMKIPYTGSGIMASA